MAQEIAKKRKFIAWMSPRKIRNETIKSGEVEGWILCHWKQNNERDNEHIKQIWMINNKNTILICLYIHDAVNTVGSEPFDIECPTEVSTRIQFKIFHERLVLATCCNIMLLFKHRKAMKIIIIVANLRRCSAAISIWLSSGWVHYNDWNLVGKSRKHVYTMLSSSGDWKKSRIVRG